MKGQKEGYPAQPAKQEFYPWYFFDMQKKCQKLEIYPVKIKKDYNSFYFN